MSGLLEAIVGQVRSIVRDVGQQLGDDGILPLLRPVAPFNEPAMLAPVVAISAMIGVVVCSGVAISAFATLMVALLALYLVLAEIFGYSFEFIPIRVRNIFICETLAFWPSSRMMTALFRVLPRM